MIARGDKGMTLPKDRGHASRPAMMTIPMICLLAAINGS